jgi:hypothetical protein
MRLSDHAPERHQEEFIAAPIAHVQGPSAPVTRTYPIGELTNELRSPFMSFDQILNVCSARIQYEALRVGTMEIDVCHDHLLGLSDDKWDTPCRRTTKLPFRKIN